MVFISYCGAAQEIAENLRSRLEDLGIRAWVYSYDRLLAADVWRDIEERMNEVSVFAFLVSEETLESEGQKRELDMALKKVAENASELKILPIALGDTAFRSLPSSISHINGLRLDAHNVGTIALRIASDFFPASGYLWRGEAWRYPIPGQWLEVCRLGSAVEEYFQLGDQVYFRRLSPMGLLECYAPRIDGLFWFAPGNVRPTATAEGAWQMVPERYRIRTMVRIEELGLLEWSRQAVAKQEKTT